MAKIFGKLEKAGRVEASTGIRGGCRLARAPENITVLDVVDAVDVHENLFDCQNIRWRCVLYEGQPPDWSANSVFAAGDTARAATDDAGHRSLMSGQHALLLGR